MSLEVKPVSSFLVYWLKSASSTPVPTQMTFEIVFRYSSVHCDMQLTFFDLQMDGKKGLQQQSLKEEFTTNNRTKRCVPSDSRISPSVSAPSKSLRHAMDQGRTFCFDLIISATSFARRKSAGGNMIGLNPQRKSHVSSGSFGGMSAGSFFRTAAGNRA